MTFRNRCQIAGSQGLVDLSIPIEGGRDKKTLMKDVRIATHNTWQDQHWKTLLSCYNRSPWFDHYRDELEALYKRPYNFLLDWNLACFEWTTRVLPMPLKISTTESWKSSYNGAETSDFRGLLSPRNRETINPPAVVYRQVFEEITGFIPHLSILDLLFCEGQRARSLLAQVGPTS